MHDGAQIITFRVDESKPIQNQPAGQPSILMKCMCKISKAQVIA
jgi:hypothetical protein